jgi:hypothetical protein
VSLEDDKEALSHYFKVKPAFTELIEARISQCLGDYENSFYYRSTANQNSREILQRFFFSLLMNNFTKGTKMGTLFRESLLMYFL